MEGIIPHNEEQTLPIIPISSAFNGQYKAYFGNTISDENILFITDLQKTIRTWKNNRKIPLTLCFKTI